MTTESVNDLQYHIEAVYFLRGPCEVHVDLSAMTVVVDDQTWIGRLDAAARTAQLRRGKLTVCQPPLRATAKLVETGIGWCDSDHHTCPGRSRAMPPVPARPDTRTG